MLHRHAGWMILNTPPLGSEDNRPRLLSGSRGALPIYNPSPRLSCSVSLWSFVTPDNIIYFHLRHVYSGSWCKGYAFPQNFISLPDRKAVYESWLGKDRIHSCQQCNLISLTKNLSPKNAELNVRAPRALIHIKSRIHGLRQLYIKGLLPNSWLTIEEIL